MPRVTRAALKIQEESDLAAAIPLPSTPVNRAPLGEISNNTVTETEPKSDRVITAEEKMAPKKGRGKTGNGTKKSTKEDKEVTEQPKVEVLEDDRESNHSSAVEEACKDLLEDGDDLKHAIVDNQRPQTPPSAAVNAVSISATPHFNPTVYKAQKEIISENKGDSFVANIESRTPAKTTGKKSTGNNGNSFIGQIKSRSPGRRISRIEDSVEALDALDEEIEKVGKLITTADGPQAPGKAKKQAKPPLKAADKKPNASMRAKYGPLTQTKPVDKRFASIRKPAAPRPSIQSMAGKDITSKKRLSIEKLSTITKSPAATHSSGNHVPPAATKKRVSSVHKAPFQTVKSTKPPTRSTFELPGEAVARKLKEQREERVKRDEEGKSKQRTTKARPVRLSQAPEVRQTATTKARLSMAQGGPATGPKAGEASTKAKPFLVGENKRTSSLSVAKRTPAPKPSANSSARVTRAPSLNVSQSGSRNPSTSGAKGKEVFSRTRIEIQEREKAKKEKEDAAKKARIEAAERGRVASREWAEKQKLRKDAQKANTEGKAVSAA